MSRQPGSRARWLVLGFLGVVFVFSLVALTVLFRDELRQMIVLPLQVWVRGVQRSWLGVEADFRWGMFIILLGTLLFLSFPALPRPVLQMGPEEIESRIGRLAFWRAELKILMGTGHINRFSINELRRLALEVVAFREQMETDEAEAWLLEQLNVRLANEAPAGARSAGVPEAMRLLVDPNALATEVPEPEPGLRETLAHLFGPPAKPADAPRVSPEQIEAIIHYLERTLEVEDERRNF